MIQQSTDSCVQFVEELSAEDIAKHLTIIEFAMFKRIQVHFVTLSHSSNNIFPTNLNHTIWLWEKNYTLLTLTLWTIQGQRVTKFGLVEAFTSTSCTQCIGSYQSVQQNQCVGGIHNLMATKSQKTRCSRQKISQNYDGKATLTITNQSHQQKENNELITTTIITKR